MSLLESPTPASQPTQAPFACAPTREACPTNFNKVMVALDAVARIFSAVGGDPIESDSVECRTQLKCVTVAYGCKRCWCESSDD